MKVIMDVWKTNLDLGLICLEEIRDNSLLKKYKKSVTFSKRDVVNNNPLKLLSQI